MVLNDFKYDIKKTALDERVKLGEIASKLGISKQALNGALNRQVLSGRFVDIMDALGYDVQVTYVRRADYLKEEK